MQDKQLEGTPSNDTNIRHLRCHVPGTAKERISSISPAANLLISELRDLCLEERFRGTGVKEVCLFKADNIYLSNHTSTSIRDLSFEGAVLLEDWQCISYYWQTEPSPDTLNVIVKPLSVWCQLFNHEKEFIDTPIKLHFLSIADISDLVLEIEKVKPVEKIRVWRCRILADPDPSKLEETIDAIDFSNKDEAEVLRHSEHLQPLKFARNEVLLAQVANQKPNGVTVWPIPKKRVSVSEFVEQKLRPMIKQSFNTSPLLVWMPPDSVDENTRMFYKNLAIPMKGQSPNLLLHRLGQDQNPYANNLFDCKDHHRFLCNTSGSGKTRILLDGLCNHWGFYFAAAQDVDRIGSTDVQTAISHMYDELIKDSTPSALDHNELIASQSLLKVLLTRWILFATFVEEAKEQNQGTLPLNFRYRWLLFQAIPPKGDLFENFTTTCFERMTTEELEKRLTKFTPEIILGSEFSLTDTFFFVLDEAQYVGKKYFGLFGDAYGCANQPVLRPIMNALDRASATHPIQCIVSGTEVPSLLFPLGRASGVAGPPAHPQRWDVVYATGDFDVQSLQNAYVARYLPPAFLSSPSGRALLSKMFHWLRGRHRFTSSFLQQLLSGRWTEKGPSSPHRMLPEFLDCLSGFTPTGLVDSLMELEPQITSLSIYGLQWGELESDEHLIQELSTRLSEYDAEGIYPTWYNEAKELVEFGVARFSDGPNLTVHIQEPLMLFGVRDFLIKLQQKRNRLLPNYLSNF